MVLSSLEITGTYLLASTELEDDQSEMMFLKKAQSNGRGEQRARQPGYWG